MSAKGHIAFEGNWQVSDRCDRRRTVTRPGYAFANVSATFCGGQNYGASIRPPRQSHRHLRSIPIAAIGATPIGDAISAADRVRSQEYRVGGSDVDLLSDFDRIVDFDSQITNGALDLGMSK
jgi:hypothetical protein